MTSRSSTRISISGISTATTTRGCATASQSPSATAIMQRCGATTCRRIIVATPAATASSGRCMSRRSGTGPRPSPRRAGSRACMRPTACRAPSSRTPRSTIPMSPQCWPNTRAARFCAASATSHARRPRPARRAGASPALWMIRAGATATRCCIGTASPSICRPRGGISTPPPISRATFRRRP